MMPKNTKPVPFAAIETRIHLIRGRKVMLDTDLAQLYGVATKNLNKAVERNRERFPKDFMCQLTAQEFADLRFQFGTSSVKELMRLPEPPRSEIGFHTRPEDKGPTAKRGRMWKG